LGWNGLLFSKTEPGGIAHFSAFEGADSSRKIGLVNLTTALSILEFSYNRFTELMPDFIRLCESHAGPENPCPRGCNLSENEILVLYPPCTSVWRIGCFIRFCSIAISISYGD
jgi:hypothetical protein